MKKTVEGDEHLDFSDEGKLLECFHKVSSRRNSHFGIVLCEPQLLSAYNLRTLKPVVEPLRRKTNGSHLVINYSYVSNCIASCWT